VVVHLDNCVSSCLIKINIMEENEKLLYEVLINYIPKISGSLEDIVLELKELNDDNRLNQSLNDLLL